MSLSEYGMRERTEGGRCNWILNKFEKMWVARERIHHFRQLKLCTETNIRPS